MSHRDLGWWLALASRRLCSSSLVLLDSDAATTDILAILRHVSENENRDPIVSILISSLDALRNAMFCGCTSAAYLGLRFASAIHECVRQGHSLADAIAALQRVKSLAFSIADSLVVDSEMPDDAEWSEWFSSIDLNGAGLPELLHYEPSSIRIRKLLGVGPHRCRVVPGVLVPVHRQVVRQIHDWLRLWRAQGSKPVGCAAIEEFTSVESLDALRACRVGIVITRSSVAPDLRQFMLERGQCLVLSSLVAEEFIELSTATNSTPIGNIGQLDQRFVGSVGSLSVFEEGWVPEEDVETFEMVADRTCWFSREHQSFLQIGVSEDSTCPVVTVLLCSKVRILLPVLEHGLWKWYHAKRSEAVTLGGGMWEKYCVLAIRNLDRSDPLASSFAECFHDFLIHCCMNMHLMDADTAIRAVQGSSMPIHADHVDVANKRQIMHHATAIAIRIASLSKPRDTTLTSSYARMTQTMQTLRLRSDPFASTPIVQSWEANTLED